MKTLKYGIKHIEGSDKARDLPLAMKQSAESIVAALDNFNYNGKDPNLVLARVAAIEAMLAATEWTPLRVNTALFTPGTGAKTPAAQRIGKRVYLKGELALKTGNLPTATAGVHAFTFPDARFQPLNYSRRFVGAYGSGNANGVFVTLTDSTDQVTAFGNGASSDRIWLEGIDFEVA